MRFFFPIFYVAIMIYLVFFVGCVRTTTHQMPSAQEQYGTPSYLDDREKGLFYGFIINNTSHMIRTEIFEKGSDTPIWYSRILLPKEGWEEDEYPFGPPNVLSVYLAEGKYVMHIYKLCRHTGKWKGPEIEKFEIGRDHIEKSHGPFVLEINEGENHHESEIIFTM